MEIFEDLNEEQKEAVLQTEGPVLILAGAGSGKTKALTHRIAYLLKEKKVPSENILAVTFTNKAAKEIAVRVNKLMSDGQTRSLPLMGTFHSICVKILRNEIEIFGYKKSFSIYDTQDSVSLVKKVMKDLEIDPKKYSPNTIKNYISGAKNELLTPEQYARLASGYTQEIAADIYFKYQDLIQKSQALDFDDLIMKCVELFQKHPEILQKYQNLFKYILVDEYQDTNHAQYIWTKLLAEKHRNLFVIGDDWQCLPGDSLVKTESGSKKIEDIKEGEKVLSASGYGKTNYFTVLNKKKFKYNKELTEIKTASGKKIYCTQNHILFARLGNENSHFVYLMYSKTKGYRIGTARGTRFDGKKHDVGLRVRANQERADRMWILKVCRSKTEATYYENLFSYKYGIPMLVFYSYSNRSMSLNQESIDKIYAEINTGERAEKLMDEMSIYYDYPHFMPQATIRNGLERLNINVVLFGDQRNSNRSSWSASRLSINTTNIEDLKVFEELGYTIRNGKSGTLRTEIHNLDFGQIEKVANRIRERVNEKKINFFRYSFMTDKKFLFMPASQIHLGMTIAMNDNGKIVEDEVISCKKVKYIGFVYDLDIKEVHNYIANGVIVHNSIYSWRGANFQNILNFEHDYPEAKIIKLEQNYRSTKTILDAAHNVIEKNESRSEKKLWTDNSDGKLIEIYEAYDERDEARFVASIIEKRAKWGNEEFNDFAVLYRINSQSRAMEEAFLQHNIPYKIVGGVRFYERKEVKDILAYLKFISSGNDIVSFDRIVNMPARGIGKESLARFEEYAKEKGISISMCLEEIETIKGVSNQAVKGFKEFKKITEDIIEKKEVFNLTELLDYVMRRSGYLNYLSGLDEKSGEGVEGEIKKENLGELLSVAEELRKKEAGYSLDDFLEDVALISDLDNYSENENSVTLMTVHSAKGLEFKNIFVVGLEEDIFPHSRSLFDPAEMEEERRLMYVAITRAKEEVYFAYANKRLSFGTIKYQTPSRFIFDISPELLSGNIEKEKVVEEKSDFFDLPAFDPGDSVIHEKFGEGIVTKLIDDDEIEVSFQGIGLKRLSTMYAPIRKK